MPRRLLVQRLQTIARLLVLVHAGQSITQQRPLHIMLASPRSLPSGPSPPAHRRRRDSGSARSPPSPRAALPSAPGRAPPCRPPPNSARPPARLPGSAARSLHRRAAACSQCVRGPSTASSAASAASCAASRALTHACKRLGGRSPTRIPGMNIFGDSRSNSFNRHNVNNPPLPRLPHQASREPFQSLAQLCHSRSSLSFRATSGSRGTCSCSSTAQSQRLRVGIAASPVRSAVQP